MMIRTYLCVVIAIVLSLLLPAEAVAQRSWDGGNATFVWGDFGNWSPDGDPNGQAISVGNLAAAANDTTLVDAAYSINSLTITNGADVINSTDAGATTEFELIVNGATTISNAGSSITVYGGVPDGLDTDTLTINSGGALGLNSQAAVGTAVVEVDNGALTNNVGGTIFGNGRIDLEDNPVAVTTLLNNEGTLSAGSLGLILIAPATTLQITAVNANARVDLDGTLGGNGIVNVNRNATLDVDVPISDTFGGDLNLSAGATLDIADGWSIDGGTVDVNTPGVIAGTAGPAAHLAGGLFGMSSGTIAINNFSSLEFDAPFNGLGGVINNSGTITVNADVFIQAPVDFNMLGALSKLVVNNSTLQVRTPDFNLDSLGDVGNVTTINNFGFLDLVLGAGADEDFDHVININGGLLAVATTDNTWSLTSSGVINAGGPAVSNISGETFQVSGDVNVAEAARLNVSAATDINGAANVDIAAVGVLDFGTVTYGNAAATYTGAGTLLKGNATISAATTWNVAVVDLDDGSTTLNANLTINANAIDISGDGLDAAGAITIADAAALTVNIAAGGSWAVDPGGMITYNGNAAVNTYLAGSDIIINGTLNHNGNGRTDARLDVGGTVNLAAGAMLDLRGGGLVTENRVIGGTINGPGAIHLESNHVLVGYGTVNANVDFGGISTRFRADDGLLIFNGSLTGATGGSIGTDDDDGILQVTNAWNSSSVLFVELAGGEVRGGTITNDGAGNIRGHGLVSAPVINNSRIDAKFGGTLVVETALNNNDWDGIGGAGSLNAVSADLEVRDNATVLFTGAVSAAEGHSVFANGFELEFQPGSTLSLDNGTYRSTHATDIRGTVAVNAGVPSRLQIDGTTVFENGSSTILTGDLELDNNTTVIQVGADFSGGGALVNLFGRTLRLNDGVNSTDFAVLVQNQGELHLSTTADAGQVTAIDYQQDGTGSLLIKIGGTGLSDFDRLSLTAAAQLAGSVFVSPIAGFVPLLGQTFTIISAPGGVSGSFTHVDQAAAVPDGLFFNVKYSPTLVQLVVVDALPGDYNHNGVVDAADYTVWRDTLGAAVTAFSGADGNGNGVIDQADYDTWKTFFGNTAAPGAGSGALAAAPIAVPEPSSLALVGGLFFFMRRRIRTAG